MRYANFADRDPYLGSSEVDFTWWFWQIKNKQVHVNLDESATVSDHVRTICSSDQLIEVILMFVQDTDLTISSSVWPMFHPPPLHLRYGTTLSVVGTRAPYPTEPLSACSVPVRPVLITCTKLLSLVLYLQCTCGPAYRYLIVQFEMNDIANFCEVEVYTRRKFLCG